MEIAERRKDPRRHGVGARSRWCRRLGAGARPTPLGHREARRRARLGPSAALGLGSLALAAAASPALHAQALPFHTETAITTGFEQQTVRTFALFAGRSGLVRDGRGVPDPMARDVDVFMQPFGVLPFAISSRWSTRIVVPVVRKSMDFAGPGGAALGYTTAGIGDALVDTKWIFLARDRPGGTLRLGVQGGLKLPVGDTDARLPDGTRAPRQLQVGTGSWDVPLKALFTWTERRFGAHANLGYRVNTEDSGFEAGDVVSYDVAVAFRLLPQAYRSMSDDSWVGYLELNGTGAGKDRIDGSKNPGSGGDLIFLSPGLQWIPTPWVLLEASVQVPVLQDLNGTQLEHDVRVAFGARYRLPL